MSLNLAAGNKKHRLADRGDDLYETPPVAVRALLAAEPLPKVIWECACGPGSIVRTLRNAGHSVYASDLVDYASDDQDVGGMDFLTLTRLPPGIEAICTNPPYRAAGEFVAKALELCPRVYMLLRLAFVESDRRRGILDSGHLARVYPFIERLPMMHRAGWQGPRASSAMAFAWFCWDCNHQGPTIMRRLSWKDHELAREVIGTLADGDRSDRP